MRADIVLLSLLHADLRLALERAKAAVQPSVFVLPPQPLAVDPEGRNAPELMHDDITDWPDFAQAASTGLMGDRGYRTVEPEYPPSDPGAEYRRRLGSDHMRRPVRLKHWPQLEALADLEWRMRNAVSMLQRGEGQIPTDARP